MSSMFGHILQWTKFNLQKKTLCYFVVFQSMLVLLLGHKTDAKEDM